MFDFLFNPKGRISRKGFVIGFLLPYLLLGQAPGFFFGGMGGWPLMVFTVVVGVFFFWPALIAVPFRRFHDFGLSGWWHVGVLVLSSAFSFYGMGQLGLFSDPTAMEAFEGGTGLAQMTRVWSAAAEQPGALIPLALGTLIGWGELLAFAVLPGQRGDNQFGRDPLASGRGFAD
jgi:uncharacterized membrane protein YhaH (DUF805 family)